MSKKPAPPHPWAEHLAAAVKSRRLHLGLAQDDLAERGGPSVVTVRQIEQARLSRPQDLTLAGLDRALEWTQGSAARVLAGGNPTVTEGNSGGEVQVNGRSVGAHREGPEPYLSRREGPNLSDISTDALLEEIAKRARSNNPDATR